MNIREALCAPLLGCLLVAGSARAAIPTTDSLSDRLFDGCPIEAAACQENRPGGIAGRSASRLVPGRGYRLCQSAPCGRPLVAIATEDAGWNRTVSGEDMDDAVEADPSDRAGYYFLGTIPLIVGIGGLIGLDHRLPDDNSGIWKRSNQLDLEYGVALTEIGGALWYGGESRIGRTYWRSIDASAFSALTVQVLKYSFSRARPYQSDNPNHWFQGSCCQSFPSGEVTFQASFITPFIIEYHYDDPWVWGLEALPLYDALARMKTQGHWQTDVLSGWALGTAFGIFAHNRHMPFFLSYMPHGIMIGWHGNF